jgi:hypothetical protein
MVNILHLRGPESESRQLIVLCLVIVSILLIPLAITGYGFLPPDDALGHAATIVSGKTWNQVLVLRDDVRMEHHPGWFAILRGVHAITNWNVDTLVVFSVIILFLLFCLVPLLFLNYPEAWPLSLLVVITANPTFLYRLLLGRPYIFTMVALVVLCFLWPKLQSKKPPYIPLAIVTLLIASAVWIHGSWFLFALPVVSFFIARQWRIGIMLAICALIGVLLGAVFTGHPFLFLKESLTHMFYTVGNHKLQRVLVGELQPCAADVLTAIAVIVMLLWRNMRGAWNRRFVDNPIFILAALGWVLGFVARRFWLDWGLPATAVWMAKEFEEVIEVKIGFLSWKRVLAASAILGALYISATSDVNSRWTASLTTEYLLANNPKQAAWLPEPGGVVYNDDMTIFYQTFFKNPHAPWRYILGFEPTMMPEEDLEILRKIQWNFGADEAFWPWVRKMRPQDRIIIRRPPGSQPKIPELEWYYAATGIWIGRLPR